MTITPVRLVELEVKVFCYKDKSESLHRFFVTCPEYVNPLNIVKAEHDFSGFAITDFRQIGPEVIGASKQIFGSPYFERSVKKVEGL